MVGSTGPGLKKACAVWRGQSFHRMTYEIGLPQCSAKHVEPLSGNALS
jgi:hypothetical protein